jgi:hypothetical protein
MADVLFCAAPQSCCNGRVDAFLAISRFCGDPASRAVRSHVHGDGARMNVEWRASDASLPPSKTLLPLPHLHHLDNTRLRLQDIYFVTPRLPHSATVRGVHRLLTHSFPFAPFSNLPRFPPCIPRVARSVLLLHLFLHTESFPSIVPGKQCSPSPPRSVAPFCAAIYSPRRRAKS